MEKGSGRLLGRCGLWQPEGWPGLEVGWTLARTAWGHGYATEAAAAWRNWAFANLVSDRLVSVIHLDNHRSAGVARRIGHLEGELLDVSGFPCIVYGQPWPRAQSTVDR